MSTIVTSTQHGNGGPGQRNLARKRNKRQPDWKGRSKTFSIHTYDLT